jgi:hypothetical protein
MKDDEILINGGKKCVRVRGINELSMDIIEVSTQVYKLYRLQCKKLSEEVRWATRNCRKQSKICILESGMLKLSLII